MIRFLCLVSFLCLQAIAINSQSYFKDSAPEYKTDFFGRAKALKTQYPNLVLGDSVVKMNSTPEHNIPLKIDFLLVPSEKKKNLVIFQSGVHGIEGLAGAGIQNFLLDYLHTHPSPSTSFLYIHMVNPWGSLLSRRTNLNNVDLNRNFVLKPETFAQKNDDYSSINTFLNPEQPYESGFFKKMFFYFDSFHLIYSYSIEILRRSILKGQYSFPKGIYFGGSTYQPEFDALTEIWKTQIQGYDKIVYIDLHTGYGEKGKLHLLAGQSKGELAQKLTGLFSPSTIDFGDTKNFYETTGDVLTYFYLSQPKNVDVYPITFEFGTLNSQSTLGSMESLYRMSTENQAYHYKTVDSASDLHVKKLFKDMFYPSDFEWRDKVLNQSKTEVDKIVQYLDSASH